MQTSEVPREVSEDAAEYATRSTPVSARQLRVVLLLLIFCSLIYVPFANLGGSGLRAIFIVLAAFAGWQLGFWLGTLAAIVILPLILALTALAGVNLAGLFSPGSAVGAAVLVAAGATAGRLRDLDAARAAAEAAMRAERDNARQQQAQADRANAETRAVLDASAEAMVLVDTQRRFLLVNRCFEEWFGISPSEVIGRDWRDMRTLVARIFARPDEFTRIVAGTAADPTARFAADVRQAWPQERELELTTMPVTPGPGAGEETPAAPTGRLYVLRDVTDEREVARLREERRRMLEEELERAARLQADLLPRGAPMLPAFDFAARCVPAYAVGGDFFDWHEPSPGVLTLTLGDVMGKGLSAALLMATVRAALEAVSTRSSPARALEAVSLATQRDLERTGAFVTLFHARVDATCRVDYADAGHGLVFVRHIDGGLEHLRERGLPLGIFPNQVYVNGAVSLAPGDALVVYSDGLIDVCPDQGAIAAQLEGAPNAASIVERLVTLATNRGPLADDLTVVVLRRREEMCGS